MGVGQLSESDAVDALRLPFYSSSHPTGSHGWRNQFDLGNPDLFLVCFMSCSFTSVSCRLFLELDSLLASCLVFGYHLSGCSRRYPGGTEYSSILLTVSRCSPNTRAASRMRSIKYEEVYLVGYPFYEVGPTNSPV